MAWWLLKSDPETYGWSDLERDGQTNWNGIKNYQARNYLKMAKRDDLVLVYHSGEERQVRGVAKVVKEAYPDGKSKEGWVQIDIAFHTPLQRPVTLESIKGNSKLHSVPLLKQSRLSVMPLTKAEFDEILKMGSTTARPQLSV